MLNVMKSLTGVKQWGVGQGNLTFKQSLQVWGMNLEGIGKNVLSAHTHPRESEMIDLIFYVLMFNNTQRFCFLLF